VPTLARELLELLDPQPGQCAIDCTFGDGGHARLVAERLGPSGTLVAIDRDPVAEEGFARLEREVPCAVRFIRAGYALLDLISFLTAGEDECRAWPIGRGTTAVKAAGKIHSDIERGFIRAEVIGWEDFARHGSEVKCREAGRLRLEGKDYVVQDGDVIHFRFNV